MADDAGKTAHYVSRWVKMADQPGNRSEIFSVIPSELLVGIFTSAGARSHLRTRHLRIPRVLLDRSERYRRTCP